MCNIIRKSRLSERIWNTLKINGSLKLILITLFRGLSIIYDAHERYTTRKFLNRNRIDINNLTQELGKDKQVYLNSRNVLESTQYVSTPICLLVKSLIDIPIDYKNFIFIDFGCGKGLSLLLAAQHPFKKIIGIEISKTTYDFAKNSIAELNRDSLKCEDIEVINKDIFDYSLPEENLCVFLYEPFVVTSPNHFSALYDKLFNILKVHCKSHYVYIINIGEDLMKFYSSKPEFDLIYSCSMLPEGYGWQIYRLTHSF